MFSLEVNSHSSKVIPCHIAIIMDGNGRWAKKRGLPRVAGHKEGINSVREIVSECGKIGVKYLTLYAFSTENWKRPQEEVSMLMRLLVKALRNERDKLHKNNVRLKVIGNIDLLPVDVANELRDAIEMTSANNGLTLVLALSYSGRWDIVNAAKSLICDVQNGLVKSEDINEDVFARYIASKDIPDPDLLIRTSGEMRISNFLLWQLAYSELYISSVFWPEFRKKQLYQAVEDFGKRERRFGMISEQVSNKKSIVNSVIERLNKSVS